MPFYRPLNIFLLLFFTAALNSLTVLETKDIENTAARDIYDLLSMVPELQGFSYGITGQPVYFRAAGRYSRSISLYVDDIPAGNEIEDISFLPVERISRIVIDERAVENDGIILYIYTKSFDPNVPVSEVVYKDAFFNYRDLTGTIAQKYSEDLCFSVSGSILDWKDKREYTDDFAYPYQRQSHNIKIRLPKVLSVEPAFETSYFQNNRYRLESDSALVKNYILTSSLSLNRSFSAQTSNRFVLVNRFSEGKTENMLAENRFTAGDSTRNFYGAAGLNADADKFKDIHARAEFSAKSFIDYGLTGFLKLERADDRYFSLYASLERSFESTFYLRSSHGYYSRTSVGSTSEFVENRFYAGKKLKSGYFDLSFGGGANIYSEPENIYIRYDGEISWKKKLTLRHAGINIATDKIDGFMISNNVTSIDFSGKYFNDKLGINMSVYHKYANYLLSFKNEFYNDLGFNFRAKIANFELFFGSDNFLKKYYKTADSRFDVNPHYDYQTIEGFDMRSRDEIWGVRWVFYR